MIWLALVSALISQPLAAEEPEETTAENSIAVVPLVNFTTDRGVGYGAYGAVFHLGPEGPGDAPYLAQIGAQFYRTTGGYQDHKLVVDLPRLKDGAFRANIQVGLETWDGAFYFGQGNLLPRVRPADTPENYYAFGLDSLRVVSNVRTPIGGQFELFTGHLARGAEITVYPDSRLEADQPTGVEGGWISQLQAGLLIDSRDHEISPTEGLYSEVSMRVSHPVLGSTWTLWGANITNRQYHTLGQSKLVLAMREAIDIQRGETPFFHQIVMGGSEWVDIGGPIAMRGLPIGRYRGANTAYGDAELRWGIKDFSSRRSSYRLFLVSFIGGARIFDAGEDGGLFEGDLAHGGAGGGIRLLYDEVFLVRVDIAAGRETYTDPADPLSTAVAERAWVPGVYVAFNAPY